MVDYSKWDNLDSDDEGEVAATASNIPAASSSTAAAAAPPGDAAAAAAAAATPPPPPPPPGAEQQRRQRPPGVPEDAVCIDPKTASPELLAELAKDNPEAMALLASQGAGGGPGAPIQQTKAGTEKGRYRFEHEGRLVYEWEQTLDEVMMYVAPPPGVEAAHIACRIEPNHLALGIVGNPPFLNEATGGTVVTDDSHWYMADGELVVLLAKMRKGETWGSVLKGHAPVDPFTREEVKKNMMLERFQQENPGFDFSGADFNGAVPDAREFMGGVKYS